ncbi:unannotated protein [freshwater metagenome]|uniref:Unannotated protein n=1 Tax=freshwater metagenome TaxID=449393 RepID=A0A6J6P6P8_9ZZZZ
MQDLDIGVKLLADAVSDERTHHAVAVRFGVRLDGLTDVAYWPIGANGLDAFPHAFFGHLDQVAAGLVDIADQECCVGIAVNAADVRGDIEVDDVAIKQRP